MNYVVRLGYETLINVLVLMNREVWLNSAVFCCKADSASGRKVNATG